MIIEKVQQYIEKLYDVNQSHRAMNYLVDRSEVFRLLSLNPHQDIPKEIFLVSSPDKETAEIALYFDQNILYNFQKKDPFFQTSFENVSDFCLLIEGVSHFIYFLIKANNRYQVTQLEMEMQAEIDKFLMYYIYLDGINDPEFCEEIFQSLFENFRLMDNLTSEEQMRYRQASSLASRYCHKLREYFPHRSHLPQLIQEIRSFYHLNQEQKMSHIDHLSKHNIQYTNL